MESRRRSSPRASERGLGIIPAKGDLLSLGPPIIRSEMSSSQALEEQREERLNPDAPTEALATPLESGTKLLERLAQEGRLIRAQLDLGDLGLPLSGPHGQR